MPDDSAPWPRRQVIPPGVWVELEHAPGSVLREAGSAATVTVDAEGAVTLSGPMRWRAEGGRRDLVDLVVVDDGAGDQDAQVRERARRARRAGAERNDLEGSGS